MHTRLAAALLLTLCWTSAAYAVDGVIEINFARASAGGITPADVPGLPITISQSGSYRLTGNLSMLNVNNDVILIQASSVEIDLNGFNIGGPNSGSGGVPDCTAVGNGRGIFANLGFDGIVVKNGSVTGIGNAGIVLMGGNSRVERVYVEQCCDTGVQVGRASLITDSIARLNYFNGFTLGPNSRISGSVAAQNRVAGIANSGGSISVESCVTTDSGHDGIIAGARSTVQANVVHGNTVNGIIVDAGSSVLDNVVGDHVGPSITAVSGGVGTGGNVVNHTAGAAFQGTVSHLYCDLDNSTKLCAP
jgi:hypothetical protein